MPSDKPRTSNLKPQTLMFQLILKNLPEFFQLRPDHHSAIRISFRVVFIILLVIVFGGVKFSESADLGDYGFVKSAAFI